MEDWVAILIASVVSYAAGFVMGCWARREKAVDKYPVPNEKTREGHPERKWEPFEFEDRTLYRLR